VLSIGLAVFATITLVLGLRHRNWGWVASGLLVICFSEYVVAEAANGWRAAGVLFVLWAFGPGYALPAAGPSDSPDSVPVTA
jgi:hypothetical protein